MPQRVDRAKAYRDRAEEVRTISESMSDPETRRQLLAVAGEYEHMADQIERLNLDPASSGRDILTIFVVDGHL